MVKANQAIFQVDFIILDMQEDRGCLLLLRRPCLETTKSLINVETRELTLRDRERKMVYKVFERGEKTNCHSVPQNKILEKRKDQGYINPGETEKKHATIS